MRADHALAPAQPTSLMLRVTIGFNALGNLGSQCPHQAFAEAQCAEGIANARAGVRYTRFAASDYFVNRPVRTRMPRFRGSGRSTTRRDPIRRRYLCCDTTSRLAPPLEQSGLRAGALAWCPRLLLLRSS